MEKKYQMKVRKHFLFLGIIPSILFVVIVIMSLSWLQNIYLVNTVQSDLNSGYHMFYSDLYEEAKMINVLIDQITDRKEIRDAFLAEDRDGLLAATRPILQVIRADYQITHCYFHGLDKKVFLRAHYPELYGDAINRFTLDEAEKTGSVSYGLELGPIGTLTLRVVTPWRYEGKIIGYLELGKEISNIIQDMKQVLETDLILVVNKSFMDKEQWENKKIERGGAGNWDQFPETVVVAMTMEKMPPIISTDLALPHHAHEDLILDINAYGRHYLAGFAPLRDASEEDIGDIIMIKDFTEIKKVNRRLTVIVLTGYLFCALLYVTFVLFYLRKLKIGIESSRDNESVHD